MQMLLPSIRPDTWLGEQAHDPRFPRPACRSPAPVDTRTYPRRIHPTPPKLPLPTSPSPKNIFYKITKLGIDYPITTRYPLSMITIIPLTPSTTKPTPITTTTTPTTPTPMTTSTTPTTQNDLAAIDAYRELSQNLKAFAAHQTLTQTQALRFLQQPHIARILQGFAAFDEEELALARSRATTASLDALTTAIRATSDRDDLERLASKALRLAKPPTRPPVPRLPAWLYPATPEHSAQSNIDHAAPLQAPLPLESTPAPNRPVPYPRAASAGRASDLLHAFATQLQNHKPPAASSPSSPFPPFPPHRSDRHRAGAPAPSSPVFPSSRPYSINPATLHNNTLHSAKPTAPLPDRS